MFQRQKQSTGSGVPSSSSRFATSLRPREISAALPMPPLLEALGIPVNLHSHRSACPVHVGDNPTAFSWTDSGLWHCFTCHAGGDKIALVRAIKKCSYRGAVEFLASVSGVSVSYVKLSREQISDEKIERARTEIAARELRAREIGLHVAFSEEHRSLLNIRYQAGNRLARIAKGAPERFARETDFAWEALAFVATRLWVVTASLELLAFGPQELRSQFVLRPENRQTIVEEILLTGYTLDDKGHLREVLCA
jgi:hypothetical protein